MVTGLVWDERYAWHDAGQVPFAEGFEPMASYDSPATKRRLYSLIEASGLGASLTRLTPRPAEDHELLRVHSEAHLARVRQASAAGGGSVGESAWLGAGGELIARLAAGGCLVAIDAVLTGQVDNAYALVRPAGHHAIADAGRGFCIYANIAVAIHHARTVHGLDRVAVVDWDVHHGNGTQDLFYADPAVLTISLHQDGNFPLDSGAMAERGSGPGEGYNLNLPLPPGSGHGAYLAAMEQVVLPALAAFRPQLIVIASGFDASVRDPLGRMLCTAATFAAMTRLMLSAAADLTDGRLLACHEGGYSESYVPFCGLATIETLAATPSGVVDPFAARFRDLPGQALQPHQRTVIEQAAGQVTAIP